MDSDLQTYFSKLHLFVQKDKKSDLAIVKFSPESNMSNEETCNSKGIIFDTVTNTIVAPNVIMPIDDSVEQLKKEGVKKITQAHDGVLFRVYYYQGTWRFSTSGMINPTKGWGSQRSFSDLFGELTHMIDYKTLDTKLCYYYIMFHPENHNVVKYSTSSLLLLEVVDPISGERVSKETSLELTLDEILKNVSDHDVIRALGIDDVGYVVESVAGNFFRFETKSFINARKLKTNCPKPKFSWTTILHDKEKRERFLSFFPSDESDFIWMDNRFNALVHLIFVHYIEYYVKRNYIVHHSRHVKTLKNLHILYLNRLNDNVPDPKITETFIRNYLLNLNQKELYYLMNPENVGTCQPAVFFGDRPAVSDTHPYRKRS